MRKKHGGGCVNMIGRRGLTQHEIESLSELMNNKLVDLTSGLSIVSSIHVLELETLIVAQRCFTQKKKMTIKDNQLRIDQWIITQKIEIQ